MKYSCNLFTNYPLCTEKILVLIYERMYWAGFDTDGPLQWTHDFADEDEKKLKKLFRRLKECGYNMDSLAKIEQKWTLKVSKIQTIPLKDAYQNIVRFNQLANYFDVAEYNGSRPENVPTES